MMIELDGSAPFPVLVTMGPMSLPRRPDVLVDAYPEPEFVPAGVHPADSVAAGLAERNAARVLVACPALVSPARSALALAVGRELADHRELIGAEPGPVVTCGVRPPVGWESGGVIVPHPATVYVRGGAAQRVEGLGGPAPQFGVGLLDGGRHAPAARPAHTHADTSLPMPRKVAGFDPERKLADVAGPLVVTVGRRAARAILIDDHGQLVLIKRTKPGQAPYWTAPGGGVEAADVSVEAALHRELSEELGAQATCASQVFLFSSPTDQGVAVQHFFVARLDGLDEAARSGDEFSDPTRGGYELDRIDLHGDALAPIDLKPTALKEFILANREALLAEAGAAA